MPVSTYVSDGIPPNQSGPVCGKINANKRSFKGSHLTLLYLMGSFLIGHMEVRHSLFYYGLLVKLLKLHACFL